MLLKLIIWFTRNASDLSSKNYSSMFFDLLIGLQIPIILSCCYVYVPDHASNSVLQVKKSDTLLPVGMNLKLK